MLRRPRNSKGSAEIFTERASRLPNRSLLILLLPIVALLLISCKSVGEGSWVTIDNADNAGSNSVYYLIEQKSPFGENEKYEDAHGHRRICWLLEFVPDSTGGSNDDDKYTSLPLDDRKWELCRELVLADEPSFVAASIPTELRSEFGLD